MEAMKSMLVAASSLRVQASRMREVADSLAHRGPGVAFKSVADDVPAWLTDPSHTFDFIRSVEEVVEAEAAEVREHYMPGHPAADERGYVRAEDCAPSTETADPESEAQIAYEATLEMRAAVA